MAVGIEIRMVRTSTGIEDKVVDAVQRANLDVPWLAASITGRQASVSRFEVGAGCALRGASDGGVSSLRRSAHRSAECGLRPTRRRRTGA
jgi:hypothetical protein